MTTALERLTIAELLNGISLRRGKHATRNDGVCAMEAAAWMAGEPHSDQPKCVCPTIAAFLRSWNDTLPDEDRDRLLKPLVLVVLGTRSTPEVARRRSLLALDWFVRVFTPAWLALTPSLEPHATALRSLAEIVDDNTASAADPAVQAANSAAVSAACSADSAARSAAYSVVHWVADSAARSAARSAVCLAARSAVDSAARSAVFSAAYSAASWATYLAARSAVDLAARSALDSAARSVLAPTVISLQQSASELVLRMVAVTEDAIETARAVADDDMPLVKLGPGGDFTMEVRG